MAPRKTVQRSIQGDGHKRGHKSYAATMNDKTLKTARRHQTPWTADDVSLLVSCIEQDERTVEMAIKLERSFYSINVARSHTAFAMRWSHIIHGHHVPSTERKQELRQERREAAAREEAAKADELAKRRKTRKHA